MNDNQNIQRSDPKDKAVVSLILGIISGTFVIIPVIIVELLSRLGMLPMITIPQGRFIFYLAAPLIAIVGLILGILSLESTKRNFAIVGIVLCIIGLVVPILYFVFS